VNLLKFFATEPDFDTVIGDLSEEFQQQLSAFGQMAARRWYWREALRNVTAFAKRELLRTPVTVLIVTVFMFVALQIAISLGYRLLFEVQWAWIPVRFWNWYQAGVVRFLFPTSIAVGAGALASYFLKARDLSLIVAFATGLTCVDLCRMRVIIRSVLIQLPSHISVLRGSGGLFLWWCLVIGFYSLGCLWIRWNRVRGETSEG
jgi:hypothetical protein